VTTFLSCHQNSCGKVPVRNRVRVSTAGQTTENQIQEIEAAGFKVETRRVVSETVSGSSSIEQRPGFLRLMDKMEPDDVLIVTKLDRLGRNALRGWLPRAFGCTAWRLVVSISPAPLAR
jgi:DNA invertase Pin-like site-specific DNA recombinase